MAQGRAHFGRDEAVNCFVNPGRVSSFEHCKPIVGGNEGIDWTHVAQKIANFAKMGVIILLQLRILESHNAPLRDGLAGPAVAAILSTCILAAIIVFNHFPDIYPGCVSGRAVRLQVCFGPSTVFFVSRPSRRIEAASRLVWQTEPKPGK
jgi:hypothetical protein